MENLLEETLKILKQNNLTEIDVIWIGNRKKKTSWENFKFLSDLTYDSGFGWHEVCLNLMIVGKDWRLERHEYDGSEWWEFKKMPDMPLDDTLSHTDIWER